MPVCSHTLTNAKLILNESPVLVNMLNHALTRCPDCCLHCGCVTGAEWHSFSQLMVEERTSQRAGEGGLRLDWLWLWLLCGCGGLNLTPDSGGTVTGFALGSKLWESVSVC